MTREEMLNELHRLKFCIIWPGNWEDIGFTERPIWVSSVGYGYYACDEPCRFEKIDNIPNDVVKDVKKVVEIGDKYNCDVEDLTSKIIENSNLKGMFADLEIDEIEWQLQFIASIPNSDEKTWFCGEGFDDWVFCKTEQELIDCFEKDASDGYFGESWDNLSDQMLAEWIDRLFNNSPDYVLPIDSCANKKLSM